MDGSRLVCAACWLLSLAFALLGYGLEDGGITLLAWGAAVVMTLVTFAAVKPGRDEHLVHPLAYRAVVGLVLGLALAGCVLALLPDASEDSQAFGVYFGVAALLVYRVLVARGSRRAIMAILVLSWTWIPFLVVTSVGCACGRYARPEHWTEDASEAVLAVFLFALPVLAVAALLAFRARRGELPEARVL
jgi:hypothetical protein